MIALYAHEENNDTVYADICRLHSYLVSRAVLCFRSLYSVMISRVLSQLLLEEEI